MDLPRITSERTGASPPPLRVFLSSTAEDLAEYRAKVAEFIDRLRQKPVRMESFGARPGTALDECRKLAAGADALVVCVAHRYGWVPSKAEGGDGRKSITWHEVVAAQKAGKPVLAFVVDPEYKWTSGEEQDRLKTAKSQKEAATIYKSVQALVEFKKFLGARIRDRFTTPDDLAAKVTASLSVWLLDRQAGQGAAPMAARASPAEIPDFTLERQRHKAFYGRQDVFAELDRLLDPTLERGWVLVTSGPGFGKSAILSRYLDRLEAGGRAVPHHFLRRGAGNTARPEVVVRSLAAQVEALNPEQARADADPANRLHELLGRVSAEVLEPRGERLVLVVDGLDEAESEGAVNPLPRFLPFTVPVGVFILCASRPTYPDLGWLEARERVRRVDLDDSRWAVSHREAVEAFWDDQARRFSPPLQLELVQAAVERAQGNLLHAVKLREWLEELPAEARRAAIVPRGLQAFLTEVWGRLLELPAPERNDVKLGLGLLSAARESLPQGILADLLDWSGEDRWDVFLHHARPLLLEEPAPWASGKRAYRLFHESFRAYLADELTPETLRGHHERLANQLATWPPAGPETGFRRRYALRYATFHRVEADDRAGVEQIATDISYLEARLREEGVAGLEADLRRALARWQGEEREVLVALERAIRTESHHLRAEPGSVATQLFAALRNTGWDEERIDTLFKLPPGVPPVRLLHPLQRRSPALRTLSDHDDGVLACAVTPDGLRLISGSDDDTLKVWDLELGSLLTTLVGHGDSVNSCAVTPDGRRVVSASDDGTLKVWDLELSSLLTTLEGHDSRVRACAVAPDGRRVVSGSDDRTLKVWDSKRGSLLATLEGHASWVSSCAVTPDGRRVVSGSGDRSLKVWDLEQAALLATLEGHGDGITSCVVTPDGQRVVSGSSDRTLKVWDLERNALLATLEGHSDSVTFCAVAPDGKKVVSGSDDCSLKVWDLDQGSLLATLEGHTDGVNSCAVTPDGRQVVSGSDDSTLKVWDLEPSSFLAYEGHSSEVRSCAVTPDGRRVVTGSWDRTLKIWDLKPGSLLTTLEGHSSGVTSCVVTPDGRRAVSGSGDHTLEVWDLEKGSLLATLEGHGGWVNSCAVSPDGRRAVSGSDDRTLKVWDLEKGLLLATLEGHGDFVRTCAVTPEGGRVVSGSDDSTLKVWDLEKGLLLATLAGHGDSVTSSAVTPDGKKIVSGSDDTTLKVWDLEKGTLLATLEGHGDGVTSCAVTPNGRRMVSASLDRTLKLWDLKQGTVVASLGGGAAFLCVDVRGDKVVAGDAAGNVWMLRLCD